jgi:sortase A
VKWLRAIAVVAVLSGGALIGRDGYLHAKAELANLLIRRAWEVSLRSGKPQRPWSWADTYPVARLRIPRLKYDEFVLEGATPRTLAFGPARLLAGARFGEPGNLAVAGHRTSWFRELEKIEVGDDVEVEWFDAKGGIQRRSYSVKSIRVIDAPELKLSSADDALTLVTCYPFGASPTSPQRFVVTGLPQRALQATLR